MGSGLKNFTLTDRLELIDIERTARFDIDRIRLRMSPYVAGVEVTQAIQYYKASQHLTDPSDRGPDNSIALAAFKPAWVRVYMRSGFFNAGQTLTGKLVVDRKSSTFPINYANVGQFTPRAPGIAVAPQSADYATERGTLGATLNFVLPSDAVHGKLRFTVIIWPQGGDENSPSDTEVVYANATLLQTSRMTTHLALLISSSTPNDALSWAQSYTDELPLRASLASIPFILPRVADEGKRNCDGTEDNGTEQDCGKGDTK